MKRRRKIPTKTELQQLQKLYKTDERIGERYSRRTPSCMSSVFLYWIPPV